VTELAALATLGPPATAAKKYVTRTAAAAARKDPAGSGSVHGVATTQPPPPPPPGLARGRGTQRAALSGDAPPAPMPRLPAPPASTRNWPPPRPPHARARCGPRRQQEVEAAHGGRGPRRRRRGAGRCNVARRRRPAHAGREPQRIEQYTMPTSATAGAEDHVVASLSCAFNLGVHEGLCGSIFSHTGSGGCVTALQGVVNDPIQNTRCCWLTGTSTSCFNKLEMPSCC
jgi:hypothetical protein